MVHSLAEFFDDDSRLNQIQFRSDQSTTDLIVDSVRLDAFAKFSKNQILEGDIRQFEFSARRLGIEKVASRSEDTIDTAGGFFHPLCTLHLFVFVCYIRMMQKAMTIIQYNTIQVKIRSDKIILGNTKNGGY